MRSYLIFLFCSVAALVWTQYANAEIYKTVDKKGNVVYTDQPPANANAKIVELPTINTLPSTQASPYVSPASNPVAAEVNYVISILSPASGELLQADQRSVRVSVSLSEDLQLGDALVYYLDGKVLEKTTATDFILNEPPRGEHKLHVEAVSENGKSLGQSNTVTIVVIRPIAHQKSVKVPGKH